ncbi:MAG: methyltransferase domain-containing protein [Pseudomonadota bacterium]
MTNTTGNEWKAYWADQARSEGEAEATTPPLPMVGGCVENDILDQFWLSRLAQLPMQSFGDPIVLELAAGRTFPALSRMPRAGNGYLPVALDISEDALRIGRETRDNVAVVAASVDALPFANDSVPIILSQFGLEYAGHQSFGEVARVLAPGGRFIAVCHYRGGALHDECAANVRVLSDAGKTNWLDLAIVAIKLRTDMTSGRVSKAEAMTAHRTFLADFSRVEALAAAHQLSVPAGHTLATIVHGLMEIYNNLVAYDFETVCNWIEGRKRELVSYQERMEAMTRAALGENDLDQIREQSSNYGMEFRFRESLGLNDAEKPAAWGLVAHKN